MRAFSSRILNISLHSSPFNAQATVHRSSLTAHARAFTTRPSSHLISKSTPPPCLAHRPHRHLSTCPSLKNNNNNNRTTTTTSTTQPQTLSQKSPLEPERKPWRAAPHRRPDEPVYELYFTCKTCQTRSGHSISKQGYHHGTVLVQCPGCSNRHLISDHLKIFSDRRVTVEDLMQEKGEAVKLGGVDQKGDVEFWTEDAVDATESAEAPTASK